MVLLNGTGDDRRHPPLKTHGRACWHIRVVRRCRSASERSPPYPQAKSAAARLDGTTRFLWFMPRVTHLPTGSMLPPHGSGNPEKSQGLHMVCMCVSHGGPRRGCWEKPRRILRAHARTNTVVLAGHGGGDPAPPCLPVSVSNGRKYETGRPGRSAASASACRCRPRRLHRPPENRFMPEIMGNR